MSSNDFNISVIIPFYKADEFFDECIESVLAQTRPAQEIIIINDNSGEASLEYLKKFNDVKIITIINLNEPHGASGARNVGLKKASGNWIAFQDADDIWELDKLETQIKQLETNDWDACHTGLITFSEEEAFISQYIDKPSPMTLSELVKSSHITPPSLLIQKSAVMEVGGFDTNFKTSGDYELSIRLVKSGVNIGFIPKVLIRVRRSNHGNVSSNGFRTFRNHYRLVCKHKDVFREFAGFNGTRKFLAKSLRESGGKIGGVKGLLVSRLGQVLGF